MQVTASRNRALNPHASLANKPIVQLIWVHTTVQTTHCNKNKRHSEETLRGSSMTSRGGETKRPAKRGADGEGSRSGRVTCFSVAPKAAIGAGCKPAAGSEVNAHKQVLTF